MSAYTIYPRPSTVKYFSIVCLRGQRLFAYAGSWHHLAEASALNWILALTLWLTMCMISMYCVHTAYMMVMYCACTLYILYIYWVYTMQYMLVLPQDTASIWNSIKAHGFQLTRYSLDLPQDPDLIWYSITWNNVK